MAEELIGGIPVAEIQAEFIAVGQPGGAGSGREVQFLRKLAALIERRMAAGETASGALFILASGIDELMEGRASSPQPLLRNGHYPISGQLWVLSTALTYAHAIDMPWTDTVAAIAQACREGLGEMPAVSLDIRPGSDEIHLSYFPQGCAVPDAQCDIHLINRPITKEEMKAVLDGFFEQSLRTPMRQREGHGTSTWQDASRGVPNSRPEEIIEAKLLERLRSAFPVHDSHSQGVTDDGYIDIAVYKNDVTAAGHPARRCDWVLELKALADRTSNDNDVTASPHDAIIKGLRQTLSYRSNENGIHAALCVYDLRKAELSHDDCFALVLQDATTQKVELWRWRLLRSAEESRRKTFPLQADALREAMKGKRG
ncbi:MAG: hypothetical protein V4618_15600 [Pseudomonadota bacterium]